jgi:hypothetical protein
MKLYATANLKMKFDPNLAPEPLETRPQSELAQKNFNGINGRGDRI